MNKLVPHGGPERIERMDDTRPGQYWRATSDVNTGSAGNWGLRPDDLRTVPAGRVLLIKEVRVVDGRVHTIILRRHPSDVDGSDHALLADDFHAAFEPAPDAAQVRDWEIAEAQESVDAARRLISTGPTDADLALPAPSPAPSVSTALAAPGTVDHARREAARHALVAQKHAEWLATRNQEMAGAIEVMADFYKERSDAALASVQEHVRYAEHLNEGVRNLELYTGENVEVELLCDGEEADPDEPLTLFQRKLYMDEEYAVHLHRGGADWSDLEDFAKSLAEDTVLLDRIIPAPRGVVVMAYRRNGKDYLSDRTFRGFSDQFAAVVDAASQNEKNRETFLLVRNGRRVHKVFSEVASDRTERLFPTRTEADKPFRGWDGEQIGLDDLRFTDALSKHKQTARHYKRLLVLLWGLNDRLSLFGRFFDLKKYRNFGALDLQRDRFRFVYDDDEETLPSNRVSFHEYVKKANAFLQPGSRVACLWKELITPDTSPSCASWAGRNQDSVHRRYYPDSDFGIAVARRRGDDLGVEVEVSGSDSKGRNRKFTAWVSLLSAGSDISFLVLDTVKDEDIEYYVESRSARRGYLSYLWLFREVRNALSADRAREADARRVLEDAVGNISEDSGRIVDETIRMWRAANNGRPLPIPSDVDWTRTTKSLLDHAFVLAGKDRDLSSDAARLLEEEGRRPLRLVMTGSGRIEAYASPTEEEVETRLGASPWVKRIRYFRTKTGLRVETSSWTVLPAFSASETTLREWPESRAFGELAPGNLSYEEAKRLLALVDAGAAMAERLQRPLSAEQIRSLINEHCDPALERLSKRKMVGMPHFVVPVAVAAGRGDRLDVVVAVARADTLMHAVAKDGQAKEEVCIWLRDTYARPDSHIERLRESTKPAFSLGVVAPQCILGGRTWNEEIGLLTMDDGVRYLGGEYGSGLMKRIEAINEENRKSHMSGYQVDVVYLPAEVPPDDLHPERTGKSRSKKRS